MVDGSRMVVVCCLFADINNCSGSACVFLPRETLHASLSDVVDTFNL